MKIKAIICDMDGVLWKDQEPIGELFAYFDHLKKVPIQYIFATNNSTKTPEQYQQKLATFNVSISANQVITSGATVAFELAKKYPQGGPVYIIGEEGLIKALEEYGFFHSESNVIAVVGGMEHNLNSEKLDKASSLIKKGADFFFSNMDSTFPTPNGIIPGAGALLAKLEKSSGTKAIVAGKPEPYMLLQAIHRLKTQPEETLVIGDRLETDILGGKNAGCKTALVLSGISSEKDILKQSIYPEVVANNLGELIKKMEQNQWKI
jgi:4-nitrophenyl phosphatase